MMYATLNQKKVFALLVLSVVSLISSAHEFWLQTEKFFYKTGESLFVNFVVGENFTGDPWDLKKNRIEKLELHQSTKITDLKSRIKEGERNNLTIPLAEEGTHVLVIQSNNGYIELEADKFNAYLKEDGLDDVYFKREKTNTLNKPSRELYSRHSKLMVQVGAKLDETFKKVMGLPIEIFPDRNPCSLKVGDVVRFKVLFAGKPLFGALVKVWNRANHRTTMQPIYTLQDGTVEIHISSTGPWMVSVVKMVPSKDARADWQSYWGSLVFGVK